MSHLAGIRTRHACPCAHAGTGTRPYAPARTRARLAVGGVHAHRSGETYPENPIAKPFSPKNPLFANTAKSPFPSRFPYGKCPFAGVFGPTVIGPRESKGCMIHPASRTAGGRGRTGITSNRRATSPRAAGQGRGACSPVAGAGKFERGSNRAARPRAGAWPATTYG
jgi:hypothetical protein